MKEDPKPHKKAKPRKRWTALRWTLIVVVSLVIVPVVLVIALGPTIAGWAAPAVIASIETDDFGSGQLSADKVELSWFGGVDVEGLKLTEADGTVVLALDVRTTRGAIGLLRNPTDLGELVASGEANLVREADGRLNVERLFGVETQTTTRTTRATTSESTSNPDRDRGVDWSPLGQAGPTVTVPVDGTLRLEGVSVSYKDPALLERSAGAFDTLRLDNADATLAVRKQGDSTLKLTAETALASGADERMGTLSLDVTGGASGAVATLDYASPDATAKLELVGDSAGLRLSSPALLEMRENLTRLVLTSAEGVSVDTAPVASLTIDRFELPTGADGGIDFGAASFSAGLEMTVASGAVTVDGKREAFTTEPLSIALTSESPSSSSTLTGSWSATLSGQEAGSFAADLVVGAFVRDSAFVVPAAATGSVKLTGVSSDLVDRLFGRTPIELAELAGKKLDVTIETSVPEPTKKDQAPPPGYDVLLTIASDRLKGQAPLSINADRVRTSKPATFTLSRLAAVAPLLGDYLTGYSEGSATLTIGSFELPLSDSEPDLSNASFDAKLVASGLRAQRDVLGEVKLLETTLTANARPGGPIDTKLDGRVAVAGKRPEFHATASFPPIGQGGLPAARIELNQLPAELARTLQPPKPLSPLIRQATGGDAKVVIELDAASEGIAPARLIIEAPLLSASAAADLSPTKLMVRSGAADWRVAPSVVGAALEYLGDTGAIDARPAGPGSFTLTLDRFEYDFEQGLFSAPVSGELLGTFALSTLDIIAKPEEEGAKRRIVRSLGPIEAQNLHGRVVFVPASEAVDGDPGVQPGFELDLLADLFHGAGVTSALSQGASAEGVTPIGAFEIDFTPSETRYALANLDTAFIAALIAPDGAAFQRRLPLAVGPKLTAGGVYTPLTPSEGDAHTARLSVSLSGMNLRMEEPVVVELGGPGAQLAGPAQAVWEVTPPYMREVFTYKQGVEPEAVLTKTAPATIDISSLVLGPGDKPMARDRFQLGASARTDELALETFDGEVFSLRDPHVDLSADPDGAIRLTIDSAQSDTTRPITGEMRVSKIADSEGRINEAGPVLNADIDVPMAPTALFDAALGSGGWLVDLLGPMFTFTLTADACTRDSGSVRADLNSKRGEIVFRAQPRDGILQVSKETRAELRIVTPQLAHRITRGLPVLPGLTKTEDQQPATVTTTGLRIPLDEPVAGLTGEIVVDPGVASLARGGRLSRVLNLPGAEKKIGEKMQPIAITAVGGVLYLPRYTLPLGEFDVDIEGKTDIAKDTMDLTMWAPLFSLTDEVAGNLGLGLGGALTSIPGVDSFTKMPIRFSGMYSDPKIAADGQLFLETLPSRALEAGPLKRGIQNLFGGGSDDDDSGKKKDPPSADKP